MSWAPLDESTPVDEAALAAVDGNAPTAVKRVLLQLLQNETYPQLFGGAIAQQMRIVEASVVPRVHEPDRFAGRVVWETVVTEGMLDARGNLDVGCIAYLLDVWATFPMTVHGMHHRRAGDNVGVSQAMQFTFHNIARLGATIRGDATSLTVGSRILSARCEMREVDTGVLIFSGVHLKVSPSVPKL